MSETPEKQHYIEEVIRTVEVARMAIQDLRLRVAALGTSRGGSLVATKLDEAELWLEAQARTLLPRSHWNRLWP